MPLAMLIGGLFYPFFSKLAAMTPCLIFCMLLITYCRLAFRDMTFSRLHFRLLGVQVVGSFVVYVLIVPFDPLLAEGMMDMCSGADGCCRYGDNRDVRRKCGLFGGIYIDK